DQKQHLELTRDIAAKFNNDFKTDFFPMPEPLIFGEATRVMSLKDGTKKMSKSDPSDLSRINMTDSADEIAKKIKKARTDAEPLPETAKGLEGRAEAANLVGIYAALGGVSSDEVLQKFAGEGFAGFKQQLADLAVAKLGPIQDEMRRLMDDPAHVDGVLKDGTERAREMAEPIIREVQDIIGFLRA
ncbi:MAG: tryptophan--tRNA ligase, partial [Rhodospirillaceae bacterium]|nr:tryptophan--tRNA ligase [Rhodospirillaceae bacterium]